MIYNNYHCTVTFSENVNALDIEEALKKIEGMSIEKLGSEFKDLKIVCVQIPSSAEQESKRFLSQGYYLRNKSY